MENKTVFWIGAIILLYYIFSSKSEKPPPTPVPYYSPNNYVSPRGSSKYSCTGDCSGHQAGYDWAEQHGITDPDDCAGNSDSFIEGCQEYAEENSDGDNDDE